MPRGPVLYGGGKSNNIRRDKSVGIALGLARTAAATPWIARAARYSARESEFGGPPDRTVAGYFRRVPARGLWGIVVVDAPRAPGVDRLQHRAEGGIRCGHAPSVDTCLVSSNVSPPRSLSMATIPQHSRTGFEEPKGHRILRVPQSSAYP